MIVKDVKKFDQQLSLIFHAIVAGPLIIYCYAYLQALDNEPPIYNEPSMMLKLIIGIVCGALVLVAFLLYKKEIIQARKLETLDQKLGKLFSGSIIHYALLEVASFVASMAFFVTHDHLFTAVYLFILFLMSLNRPTPHKYIKDLVLKGNEKETVIKKQEIS